MFDQSFLTHLIYPRLILELDSLGVHGTHVQSGPGKLIEAEDQFGPSLTELNALVEMKGRD